MKKKINIVDYGLGNILSAEQSFVRVIKENQINADINEQKPFVLGLQFRLIK